MYIAFFVSRMTDRHGHWVCCMSMGMEKAVLNTPTASSKVEHAVEVTSKETAVFGHVSQTDIRTRNNIV